jgi:hypothetical protein
VSGAVHHPTQLEQRLLGCLDPERGESTYELYAVEQRSVSGQQRNLLDGRRQVLRLDPLAVEGGEVGSAELGARGPNGLLRLDGEAVRLG